MGGSVVASSAGLAGEDQNSTRRPRSGPPPPVC